MAGFFEPLPEEGSTPERINSTIGVWQGFPKTLCIGSQMPHYLEKLIVFLVCLEQSVLLICGHIGIQIGFQSLVTFNESV